MTKQKKLNALANLALVIEQIVDRSEFKDEDWKCDSVRIPANNWGVSESGGAITPDLHLIDWSRARINEHKFKIPFTHPEDGWEENPEDDTVGRVYCVFKAHDLIKLRTKKHRYRITSVVPVIEDGRCFWDLTLERVNYRGAVEPYFKEAV